MRRWARVAAKWSASGFLTMLPPMSHYPCQFFYFIKLICRSQMLSQIVVGEFGMAEYSSLAWRFPAARSACSGSEVEPPPEAVHILMEMRILWQKSWATFWLKIAGRSSAHAEILVHIGCWIIPLHLEFVNLPPIQELISHSRTHSLIVDQCMLV